MFIYSLINERTRSAAPIYFMLQLCQCFSCNCINDSHFSHIIGFRVVLYSVGVCYSHVCCRWLLFEGTISFCCHFLCLKAKNKFHFLMGRSFKRKAVRENVTSKFCLDLFRVSDFINWLFFIFMKDILFHIKAYIEEQVFENV